MSALAATLGAMLGDVTRFSAYAAGLRLRQYQCAAARAITGSVVNCQGLTFVVIFPRQSGKNELQAHIEAYLLTLLGGIPAEMVKVSPTWRPQSLTAMRRLERVLRLNRCVSGRWSKERGFIYRHAQARMFFLSAEPSANIVGATASALLECDEAQNVRSDKWDREIHPMAASTNATRVFWGTAWTSQTLLAREKRASLEAQQADGIQRVFLLIADEVRRENRDYGAYVDGEVARMGRSHPFVRSQYFSEEIDAQAGMFTAERLALMQGTHAPYASPLPGALYAFCIDVGGATLVSPAASRSRGEGKSTPELPLFRPLNDPYFAAGGGEHDATVLTVFEVDLDSLEEEGLHTPTFRTVHRRQWSGAPASRLYPEIRALIELWRPQHTVIDATGLGEGLAAFLLKAYPAQVIPFKFNQSSKSHLGWTFISIVDAGCYKEHERGPQAEGGGPGCGYPPSDFELQAEFFRQARAVEWEVLPGPQQTLRYRVPDGRRDLHTGRRLHDDLVISAMLCAALVKETWGGATSVVIPPQDPLWNLSF